MEKSTILIAGAIALGYSLATIYRVNEIKQSDCDVLKAKYGSESNVSMGLLALGSAIVVIAGILR